MGKEALSSPPPSLRDYWDNPTGFPPDAAARRPQRRALYQMGTPPSLWEPEAHADPGLLMATDVSAARPGNRLSERVEQRGVSSLPTEDLLSLVLRTGPGSESIEERVQELLKSYSLHELLHIEFGELSERHRLGKDKAAQLQALCEVWRRLSSPSGKERPLIRTAGEAVALVRGDLEHLDHEEMRVLLLDTKSRMVANLPLYRGTVNSSEVRIAEVLRPAVARNCPGIVACHNHPSGDPEPSPEDIQLTHQLRAAGTLIDVELVDHIIIGDKHRFTSLRERIRW